MANDTKSPQNALSSAVGGVGSHPRVAVIGAGIIGLAIAVSLAARGAKVTIVDSGYPGGGTSGTSFAWVNSNGKQPRAYHDLNVAGLRAHLAWQADVPDEFRWFHQAGAFEWAGTRTELEELEKRVKALRNIGYAAGLVDAREARLANPGLRVPDGPVGAFAEEGYVLVSRFVAWALLKLKDAGTEFRFGQAIVQFRRDGRGHRLLLENGDEVSADHFVLAAGRWTKALLNDLGYVFGAHDPLEATPRVRSILAYTSPLPVQLRSLVFSPQLNVRPDGGGRLVLQSIKLDDYLFGESDLSPSGILAEEYRKRIGRLLPFLPPHAIQELRVGRRSLTADGLPAVGRLEDDIYVAATHSGVTLAPALADIAADEILAGTEHPAMAAFRPRRLIDTEQAGKEGRIVLHSAQ